MTERFEVKMAMMAVISRLIGRHKLILLGINLCVGKVLIFRFLSFFTKILLPSSKRDWKSFGVSRGGNP